MSFVVVSMRLNRRVDSFRQIPQDVSTGADQRTAEDLLARIASQRDTQAFAALFASYAPRLKGLLLARGAEPAVAEEIIQDVMLSVWSKSDRFDADRGAASTWLFALTRNAFVDRIRRQRRPEVDPADPLLEGNAPAADRLLLAAESQRELAAAVARLPPDQQDVVRRSYFHGQSMSQIAAEAGLPLGTVKTRARLALEHLRALVGRGREQ